MSKFTKTVVRVLASRKFFWIIVALLVFQALWLALSFKYAMLWDEEYHFSLIQFYAHHLNPFITNQPHSLDALGNVERSPKYLYHWLMSFPFRGISLVWHTQTSQVIALRIINIAMFAAGLVAFARAMSLLTKSRAIVNLTLLVLVLLPISSLLAAQINYDNMLFLLAGLIFYWSFKFIQSKADVKWLLLVSGVGLLTCLVEYNYLPVFIVVIIFLLAWMFYRYRGQTLPLLAKSFSRINKLAATGLVILVLIGLGLFIERFGVNVVRYHSLNPQCTQVISLDRCLKGSAYQQGHRLSHRATKAKSSLSHAKPAAPDNAAKYLVAHWLEQIYIQYFDTGQRITFSVYDLEPVLPIPIAVVSLAALASLASLIVLIKRRQLAVRPEYKLVIIATLALSLVLFVFDYKTYLSTHAPLAIQGRYLMPVVPLVIMFGVIVVSIAIKSNRARSLLAVVVILGLLAGGGILTSIIRSADNWYWPNKTVIGVNRDVRNSLHFLTLGLGETRPAPVESAPPS